MVSCGVVVPILVILCSYEARAGASIYGSMEEIKVN